MTKRAVYWMEANSSPVEVTVDLRLDVRAPNEAVPIARATMRRNGAIDAEFESETLDEVWVQAYAWSVALDCPVVAMTKRAATYYNTWLVLVEK